MLKKTKINILALLVFIASFFFFDRLFFHLIHSQEKIIFKTEDPSAIFLRKNDFNRNFFRIPRGTYDTLIMGTSRTYRAIHPFYLHKYLNRTTFKIAGAPGKPKYNYYFYQLYKQYAGIPQMVIYGMDYFMFSKSTNDPFVRQFIAKDGQEDYQSGPSLLIANKEQINEFLINILEMNTSRGDNPDRSKSKKKKRKIPPIIDPFTGYEAKKSLVLEKPYRFNTFEYHSYPGLEGIWFFKLLNQLKKEGVTVALVFLPSLIGTYESNFQNEDFKSDIRNLTKPFDNVYIFDYNHPEKFPLARAEFFQDGGYGRSNSHLSARGSEVLNRMLCRDLKKIESR